MVGGFVGLGKSSERSLSPLAAPRRRRERLLTSVTVTVETLEERFLLSGTSPNSNLGTVGTTQVSDANQTVSLLQGADSNGNKVSTPTNRLLLFTLASPENQLSLSALATSDADFGASGDLQIVLASDANNDGQLEQSELSQPVAPVWKVSSNQAKAAKDSVTLPAGAYFAELSVTNFQASSSSGEFEAEVDYTLDLSSAAVPLPGIAVSDGSSIQNGASTTSSSNGTDFGTVPFGANDSSQTHTFTIQNTGSAALTLGAANLNNGSFQIVSGPPTSIAGNSSGNFSVELLSSSAGQKSATVSIATNVSGENPFTFALSGVVSAPAEPSAALFDGNTQISNGQGSAINFGNVTTGSAAPTQTFTLNNTGNAALSVGAISVPQGFALTSPPSGSVAAGSSTSFTISLGTASVGNPGGQVSFSTNDPNAATFTFPISGAITAAPEPNAEVLDGSQQITNGQASAITFTSVAVGAPGTTQTFTVKNNGSANLIAGTVSVPAGFMLTSGLTSPIAPGDSGSFTVQMNTTTAGVLAGSVSFTTNDPTAANFSFPISGTVQSVGGGDGGGGGGGGGGSAGGGGGSGGTPAAFTPTISGKLPTSVIAGQKTSISETVTLINSSGSGYQAPATTKLFLSTGTSIDGSSIPLPDQITKTEKLKAGAHAALKFSLKSLPASVPNGTYHLLAEVTDQSGNSSLTASNGTITVAPRQIDLSLSLAKFASTAVAGKKLTETLRVANNGNSPATGSVPIVVYTSPDGLLSDATQLASIPKSINAKPFKPITIPLILTAPASGTSDFLIFQIDPNNQFRDINLTNNIVVSPSKLTVS
jgi:hypothetical protein